TTRPTSAWKSAPRAQKSVSQFVSTRTALPSASSTRAAMIPSPVARPALFAAAARPFLRRTFSASTRSPPVSASALLHSIIPTPVFSRSSFTRLAEITIASSRSSLRQKAPERPLRRPEASLDLPPDLLGRRLVRRHGLHDLGAAGRTAARAPQAG